MIGVGGIMTRDDGLAMLDAGARLMQVYTGFIYGGPGLVAGLNRLEARRKGPDDWRVRSSGSPALTTVRGSAVCRASTRTRAARRLGPAR